jgi:mono/diheme cytochrome c family protein
LVVSIFLALYFIKMILLLMNKKEQLTNFRKWTKVPEIIVSTLFLVTGIWMLILKPTMSIFQVIKLAAVVAAIPCGVIGFVRGNKILGVLSFVLIVAAYGLAEMGKKFVQKVDLGPEIVTDIDAKEYDQLRHGEALYREYCKSCHGPDGKLGLGGAYDLATSRLSDSDAMTIIMNGKGTMPGFKQVLTPRDANAVLEYIKTLRTE